MSFPKIDNLNWKDITPKMGATYDLLGNGKRALKVTLNKYLEGMGTTGFGPAQVTDAPNPLNHELAPRVSLNVQYARRWYGNIRVTDDRSVTPADYNRFTINVPVDSRLPDGGGYRLTGFDITSAANARPTDYFLLPRLFKMSAQFDF